MAENWIHGIINRPLILPLYLHQSAGIRRCRDIRDALHNRLTTFEYTSVTALLTEPRYILSAPCATNLSFHVQEDWASTDVVTWSFYRTERNERGESRFLSNLWQLDVNRT